MEGWDCQQTPEEQQEVLGGVCVPGTVAGQSAVRAFLHLSVLLLQRHLPVLLNIGLQRCRAPLRLLPVPVPPQPNRVHDKGVLHLGDPLNHPDNQRLFLRLRPQVRLQVLPQRAFDPVPLRAVYSAVADLPHWCVLAILAYSSERLHIDHSVDYHVHVERVLWDCAGGVCGGLCGD